MIESLSLSLHLFMNKEKTQRIRERKNENMDSIKLFCSLIKIIKMKSIKILISFCFFVIIIEYRERSVSMRRTVYVNGYYN